MNEELKRELLLRKFSSVEYMIEMSEWHRRAIEALESALEAFFERSSEHGDWHQWPASDWPETWRDRVLKNLKGEQVGIDEGIENYKKGQISTIRSASGSLHGIFRNLDNFSWGWWERLPSRYEDEFRRRLVNAKKRASLIMYTLSSSWEVDEILDEEITGPVDEEDLKRYLKPGESAY